MSQLGHWQTLYHCGRTSALIRKTDMQAKGFLKVESGPASSVSSLITLAWAASRVTALNDEARRERRAFRSRIDRTCGGRQIRIFNSSCPSRQVVAWPIADVPVRLSRQLRTPNSQRSWRGSNVPNSAPQRNDAMCHRRTHAPQQTPPYSITSSASAVSVAGISSPIDFAVFKLMTNW